MMSSYTWRCPKCGSSYINTYRMPYGAIWCEECGYKEEEKEKFNPFIIEKEKLDKNKLKQKELKFTARFKEYGESVNSFTIKDLLFDIGFEFHFKDGGMIPLTDCERDEFELEIIE